MSKCQLNCGQEGVRKLTAADERLYWVCDECYDIEQESRRILDKYLHEDFVSLGQALEKSEADKALMREALEAVEWVPHHNNPDFVYCPFCGAGRPAIQKAQATRPRLPVRQRALGTPSSEILEYYKRKWPLEKE